MKIEVKHLLSQAEGSSETYPLELANLPIDETASARFMGEATLTKLNNFILAQITGEAQIAQPCHRCLKNTELRLPLNFSREFKTEIPGPDYAKATTGRQARNDEDESEEAYPIVDGQINLAPLLAEEIVVSVPLQVLCREDCQGLCPECGANLNDNPCKCDKVKDEISNKIKF